MRIVDRMASIHALPDPTATAPTGRHLVRSWLWASPAVYLPIARRRYPGPSPKVIGPETQLVIEGYMRSANTYAVHAFQSAQRRPVLLAHHLHAPAQLIAAVRRGIPALALIREPEDAILSQVQWEPDVSMAAALSTYARFYRALEPYVDGLMVATFTDVTDDLGRVIGQLNARFGTTFDLYEATEENERLCFELMQERASAIPGWRTLVQRFESGEISREQLLDLRSRFPTRVDTDGDDVWSPSAERRRTKEALRRSWNEASLAAARAEATSVYHAFLTAATRTRAPRDPRDRLDRPAPPSDRR